MGHGDYILFADAHFPSYGFGSKVIRADALRIDDLLKGVMPLFELDSYVEHPVLMMAHVEGDHLDDNYVAICEMITGRKAWYLERFTFYEDAKRAFAIIQTGETRQYGNIILQKGVIF